MGIPPEDLKDYIKIRADIAQRGPREQQPAHTGKSHSSHHPQLAITVYCTAFGGHCISGPGVIQQLHRFELIKYPNGQPILFFHLNPSFTAPIKNTMDTALSHLLGV